jgi:phosphoserine phosphatase
LRDAGAGDEEGFTTYVEAAVAFYLDARREDMQAGMRELLSELDGSRASRVAMLAGMTRAELESVGGRRDRPSAAGQGR